jgi:tryptophan-rich sensory protein
LKRNDAVGLALFLLLTFAAAALGGWATKEAGAFYGSLVLPFWAPPAWLFGPVWTALYALMAVAAWLVWRDGKGLPRRKALTLFLAQLGLNALWSWLFFAWHLGGAAFFEVLLLTALVGSTIKAFHDVRRLAAFLLFPYLAWLLFASALALAAWRLNPALLGG